MPCGLLVEDQLVTVVIRIREIVKTLVIVHALPRLDSVSVVYVISSAGGATVDVLLNCLSIIKGDGHVDSFYLAVIKTAIVTLTVVESALLIVVAAHTCRDQHQDGQKHLHHGYQDIINKMKYLID